MQDEIWTTKDGRKIAVGDMDVEHLRNTLRMVLRKRRILMERAKAEEIPFPEENATSYWDYKNISDAQAHKNLANLNAFFRLLEAEYMEALDYKANMVENEGQNFNARCPPASKCSSA